MAENRFRSIEVNVENNAQHPHTSEVISLEIKGLATVKAYQSHLAGSVDLSQGPMDVVLISIRQGQLQVLASFIPHPLQLNTAEAIFLAFPKGQWEAKLIHAQDTHYYVTHIEAGTLHKLINPSFDGQQLNQSSRFNMRDLMKLIPLNPSLLFSFDQLFYHKMQPPFSTMFEQAKFMEIFSLVLETAFGQRMDACPVILSPVIEQKIHQVRRHILENIEEVPDPDQLAVMYDLPRNTLREGYRYLFGKTIHQYHADHKLESAMQMLSSGELLVKEIAFKIGYQNPSHFISAFKKKYGFTPKQFLKQDRVTMAS